MRYSLKLLFLATIIAALVAWIVASRLDDPIAKIRELGLNYSHYEGPEGDCHYVCITSPPFDPSRLHDLVSAMNRIKEPFEIYLDELPDRYVSELKRAKNIPRIYIAESGLGNKGLVSLASISSLKEVKIERCVDLNHDGVVELRALRPDINIYGWWMDKSNPNILETVIVSMDGTETRFKHPANFNNGG